MLATDKSTKTNADSFCREIEKKSGQSIGSCYQCMKCAGGCPLNFAMERNNYEILRLIQLGEREEVLKSNAAWLCVGCKACSSRCPNGIDTSKILDIIKMETILADSIPAGHRNINIFYQSFLHTVQGLPLLGGEGRSYELGLVGIFKLRTGSYFADMDLGGKFIMRNKLPFLPHRALKRRKGEVKKIFKAAKERKEK